MNSSRLWANNRIRLVVTSQCNIACFYCHNEGQPKGNIFLSDDLFQKIIDIISRRDQELDAVTFSGGEPLLHPRLEKFIEHISKYCNRRTIVTNGLLLTRERLLSLQNSGVTKIRMGIDSMLRLKSRPTSGNASRRIQETMALVMDSGVPLEVNVVLTRYNITELPYLLDYFQKNKISAKFFEHVKVQQFGTSAIEGKMRSFPMIPFDQFDRMARSTIQNCTAASEPRLGESNSIYIGDGFTIRYCRYLCDYGLCYMTGTRIDPSGSVYACMENRGRHTISPKETPAQSILTIESAVEEGCQQKIVENVDTCKPAYT